MRRGLVGDSGLAALLPLQRSTRTLLVTESCRQGQWRCRPEVGSGFDELLGTGAVVMELTSKLAPGSVASEVRNVLLER